MTPNTTLQSHNVQISTKGWDYLNVTINNLLPSKIVVLMDENTHRDCYPLFIEKLNKKHIVETITITPGETYKTIETCLDIWNKLSHIGADRSCLLINLGGGVITDMGGFVACTYKRGIAFINIPTTLLAMVDASVGGKNGVDLGNIKNQIGIIKKPEFVLVESQFLNTLPKNELVSGYAEMLKHGIIASKSYWEKLKSINPTIKQDLNALIWESIIIKDAIVTKDPLESNERKALNYGHTLGHAIESYCMVNNNQQPLLHGEAIAIGMILATFISNKLLKLPQLIVNEVTKTILQFYPKVHFTQRDILAIISLLKFDKKNKNGDVLFVLIKDFNQTVTDCKVSNELIFEAFEYYKNFY